LGSVDAHFDGKDPAVRAAFVRVLAVLAPIGPVDVLAERSRIALHARMSFAAFMPRRHWLDGHLVLARQAEHPLFRKVEVYSARNVLHAFGLTSPAEVDDAFAALVVEAYAGPARTPPTFVAHPLRSPIIHAIVMSSNPYIQNGNNRNGLYLSDAREASDYLCATMA
jgi:hypothetical protein